MVWQGSYKSHQTWRNNVPRIVALAKKLYTGASEDIAKMIVSTMEVEEIVERLGDLNALSDDLKAQLLISYPALHKYIDTNALGAEHRIIMLCLKPTKPRIKKFDFNADDLKLMHYDYLLNYGNKNIINEVCEGINDEKLSLFKTGDWASLLHFCPALAARFNFKAANNLYELRHLILRVPSILNHVTIEDMQNCIIDGPTWIRIITKMRPRDRCFVPKGFKEWVARDIFKLKLTGRKFKAFKPDWTNGLQE